MTTIRTPRLPIALILFAMILASASCSTRSSLSQPHASVNKGSFVFRSPANESHPSFAQEFADAKRFQSAREARRSNGTEADSAFLVLEKWLRTDPTAVLTELSRLSTGSSAYSLGILRSRRDGDARPVHVVARYRDAAEILARNADFALDSPRDIVLGLRPETARAIEARITGAERAVRSIALELAANGRFDRIGLDGRAISRLEVPKLLGRLLPLEVNSRVLGGRPMVPATIEAWSRAWRDAAEFNFWGDPRVDRRASTAIQQMRSAPERASVNLTDSDLITILSRQEITQTAIAHALDVLLEEPAALEAYAQATRQGDQNAQDALLLEALRLNPVYPLQVRLSTRDITLASGLRIPAGLVILPIAALNRDAAQFAEPDRFSSARSTARLANQHGNGGRPLGTALDQDLDSAPDRNRGAGADILARLIALETREAVAALALWPRLRRATGETGRIDRRFTIEESRNPFVNNEWRYVFPERFAVEADAPAAPTTVQIPDSSYPYESFLNDYDRESYRLCMSAHLPRGYGLRHLPRALIRAYVINRYNLAARDNKDMLFCRLNEGFRACVRDKEGPENFHHLRASDSHERAFESCRARFPLTTTETAFYRQVMLDKPLDDAAISTRQSRRASGPEYEFEDHILFHDRYTYREALMNAVGMAKFRGNHRDLLFYARLNLDFRYCMGFPVMLHELGSRVGLEVGREREAQYELCKNGKWNPKSLRYEGALSDEEKHYYERLFLGRQPRQM